MSRKDNIYVYQEDRRKNRIFGWVFFGIFGLIAIYVPFFGINLQYQIGSLFYLIFSKLGELCMYAGWILLGFNIITVFITRKIYIKSLVFSVLLLWIGAFLTGQAFDLFSLQIGGNQPPKGYH